jgi:hypothetical protein
VSASVRALPREREGSRGGAGAPALKRLWAIPPWTLTAVLGLIYVIAAPPSSDLAAAAYRSALFSAHGFTLWDNSWYAGHHLPAYSLLAPALGAAIGPQLLAAISMTVAAWLFTLLVRGRRPLPAPEVAALWFAWGAAVSLLSSRVPFDLGLAIGAAALVTAQRGNVLAPLALAVLCAVASPVAGAFLALAFLAWALAGGRPLLHAAMAAAALAPVGLLALLFPEGGTQPFAASAFYPAFAGVLAVGALLPREQRVLRVGTVLYAVALAGAYFLHTPVGGNAERLGALAGGPVAAFAAADAAWSSWRMRALLVLTPALLYWQANAPAADFAAAASDPGVRSSYYAPLVGELRTLGVGYGGRPARVEVVPLADHWEARWMGPVVMLARGWERQLDTLRNGLFYGSAPLTAAGYGAWLQRQSVTYVALPDAAVDYSAVEEARLLRGQGVAGGAPATGQPPAYLREVWRSPHWRLFAVIRPAPLAQPPAVLTVAGHDSFALTVPGRGNYQVQLHFTPYWKPLTPGACVREGAGEWTVVSAARAGTVRVGIGFSFARAIEHSDPRCA